MKNDITIGKFLLESITTGMYTDSRIIFREYIQNSTDAIDMAMAENIITKSEARIDISIDNNNKKIVIRDNGIGIHSDKAWNTLVDIGRSGKHYDQNRGFRGIGRLGGISYCDKLIFSTTSKGDSKATIVSWDCKRLKELIQPGQYEEYDLPKVIDDVTNINTIDVNTNEHFFEVIMENIDDKHPELLDVENIENYISQVAPIPFNDHKFCYAYEIERELKLRGKDVEEYNIYLNKDPNPLYKSYQTWFTANKKRDEIVGLTFFEGKDENDNLLFIGWYANSQWLGTVEEKHIKGLRVRKNNILIGDENTLNDFFSETRFNGWVIGEVYVYEKKIIPNARRDYFEQNQAYWTFKDKLEKITRHVLSEIPDAFSDIRSNEKKIISVEKTLEEINLELNKGVTESRKSQLFNTLDSTKAQAKQIKSSVSAGKEKINNLASITSADDVKIIKTVGTVREPTKGKNYAKKKEEILKRINIIENNIINNGQKRRTDEIPTSYSGKERRLIELVFEIIDSTLEKNDASKLTDKILDALKNGFSSKLRKDRNEKNTFN